MDIHAVGFNFCHDSTFRITRPGGSGDFLLLIVHSCAVFRLDGKEILTSPNSIILYRGSSPQIYRAAGDIFSNDWIHFGLDPSEIRDIENMGIPFDTVITCGDTTALSLFIKNIYCERYSANPHSVRSMHLYLQLLLIKLSEAIRSSDLTESYPYYEKLSALRIKLYRNPSKNYSITELAGELILSESYFQHLYKRFFGVGVIADVINARIEHGKYLLSGTDYPVCAVAEMCGYRSDVHFMRQFKHSTGLTPSQYRRRFKISASGA